jgi:pullulanase/glycogen debranching enzyme
MKLWPGKSYPLGTPRDGAGVNFSLFSENGEKVEVCLFDSSEAKESARIPLREKTVHVWHIYLPEVRLGQVYGYRGHGPYQPEQGHRFIPAKLLLDPYATATGEDNRDGHNDNLSWNCYAEGPADDIAIIELRERQKRNFVATLLLSQGVPMLLAGDEIGRSHNGNNNSYCQDNEISWVDWNLDPRRQSLLEFTRDLIQCGGAIFFRVALSVGPQ